VPTVDTRVLISASSVCTPAADLRRLLAIRSAQHHSRRFQNFHYLRRGFLRNPRTNSPLAGDHCTHKADSLQQGPALSYSEGGRNKAGPAQLGPAFALKSPYRQKGDSACHVNRR
jgi:hypothetical protein